MDNRQRMTPEVRSVLKKLVHGQVVEDMCTDVRKYADEFLRMGISSYDLMELLELKRKVAFLPDSFAYLVERPGRGDYLLANYDKSFVKPVNENERRFLSALQSYYQDDATCKQKADSLSQLAKRHLNSEHENAYYKLGEEQELGLLVDIVLNRDIDRYPYHYPGEQQRFLKKFDLYDAYHVDDDRMVLRWKAGEMLESKGLLNKGSVEHMLREVGLPVEKLRNVLCQYKIDGLRVSNVEVFTEKERGNKCIRCLIDGGYQPSMELSSKDAELLDRLENWHGMAAKYYVDVLNRNRKENRMVADEKTLTRMSMPYVDRMVDIYKYGLNEQDIVLLKASQDLEIDSFCWDNMMLGLEEEPIEMQKNWAFDKLTNYIADLRPGQLAEEDIVSLIETIPDWSGAERKEEKNLMELPETFFPIVEQSGKIGHDVIDYVKVQRGIERTTPDMAYNSMCYFLSHRLQAEWDPIGADDEYGQVVGGYYYPNKEISNPAEKFPVNLLSEKQWSGLAGRYSGEAAEFIPYTAFRKNRITGVQIYPMRNGDLNIRCLVDGEQQAGKRLSETDAMRCKDEKTDLNELAVGYFANSFAREGERNMMLSR